MHTDLQTQVSELSQKLDLLLSRQTPTQPKQEIPVQIDEAAKILGLAKITIYIKTKSGEIPAYKKGGKLFFYTSELLHWINTGKRKTGYEINAAVDAAIQSHA